MAASSGLSAIASKFRGCLIGSHIGDCLGAPFEEDPTGRFVSKTVLTKYIANWLGDSQKVKKKDACPLLVMEGVKCRDFAVENDGSGHWMSVGKYSRIRGLKYTVHTYSGLREQHPGPVQVQPYTDDTVLTLCIAKSLIENKGFDAKDIAKRFVSEYFSQPRRGYGSHVGQVFRELSITDCSSVFEPATKQFHGMGSYGNGAAMRIAPIALYGYNKEESEMIQIAKESSLITHSHQNGYNGAILQCLAIHRALNTSSTVEISPVSFVSGLLEKMEELEKPLENAGSLETKRRYCSSLKKIVKIFENSKSMSPEAVGEVLGNGVAAHRSVPTAIYSFLKGLQPSDDFENDSPFVRTMYHSVSVGGDTDTIAAMAGSISGAYHGIEVIPPTFLQRCEAINESERAADQLFELCCGSGG